MAIYHLAIKPVSRGEGRSATAAAAYRSASRIVDHASGKVFDFTRKRGVEASEIVLPGRTLWILHPRGEPLPVTTLPVGVQVMLLDASWPEASRMTQTVAPWGRLVRLPMMGPSRYRLREQKLAGNYSTIEALLFLLTALGLTKEEAQLRLQFELHVYAGLRARGNKAAAAEYLATSPVREAFPELLQDFDRSRPDC